MPTLVMFNVNLRFTTHLDAAKSGLRPRLDVFERDNKMYNCGKPQCFRPEPVEGIISDGEVKRVHDLDEFILDALLDEGKKLMTEYLLAYQKASERLSHQKDQDLCHPYFAAVKRAERAKQDGVPGLHEELKNLTARVRELHKQWPEACSKKSLSPKKPSRSKGTKAASPKDNAIADLAKRFALLSKGLVFFSETEAQTISGSYAYECDHRSQFAFSVALPSLCAIKARAQGSTTMTRSFASSVAVPSSVVRVLAAQAEKGPSFTS
jgi:hypothetical protein